jgi:hypothetical protein
LDTEWLNTIATKGTTTTWPSSFSIHDTGNATQNDFSDEGQWIFANANQPNKAPDIEGGFYSGMGNSLAWTNHQLPYYTVCNGSDEHDDSSVHLSASTSTTVEVRAASGKTKALVSVAGHKMYPASNSADPLGSDASCLNASNPGRSFAMGEVNSVDHQAYPILMGGHANSPGEPFVEYWGDNKGGWHLWSTNQIYKRGIGTKDYGYSTNQKAQWSNWGGSNT